MRIAAEQRTRGLTAAGVLLLAHLTGTGLLLWGTTGAWSVVREPGPTTVDAVLALVAAAAAWLTLTWLTAMTVLTLLTAAVAGICSAAHQRAAARTPLVCRRLAGALLGLTIASGPLACGLPVATARPATATASAPLPALASDDRAGRLGTDDLDRPAAGLPPGWTPDRPAVLPRRDHRSAALVRLVASPPRTGNAVLEEVVVRGGDTLWDIAARHLGADASAAEVAAEWPRWYAANRAVIGPDPDLLLPGQQLLPPHP